jgi:predicted O-linked N-acetylglucosamine transferase (SPINDLY family)
MMARRSTEALFAEAYAHHCAGRTDEAARLYESLLKIQPANADALHLLGVIAMQGRDFVRARKLISAALALYPNHPNLLNSLGETLRQAGLHSEAEPHFRRALELSPGNADALNNLGALLTATRRTGEAVHCFEAVLASRPDDPVVLVNLARALALDHRPDAALEAYGKALRQRPNWPDAVNPSALLLKNLGRIGDAIARLEACLGATGDHVVGSNLLLTYCYDIGLSPPQLLERHRQVAARIGFATMPRPSQRHAVAGKVGKSLRIGFVSGDFREHPVAFFLLPLLRGLKTLGLGVFAYSNHPSEDGITEEIRSLCTRFNLIDSLTDDQVVRRIRNDAIDVLVDLSGYTANNRLPVFLRRPATLQVSWIGYLASTGLDCFDAHLRDDIAVPAAMGQAVFSEPVAYLPGCQWCYAPPPGSPPVQPRLAGDFVFGAFHNAAKLNDEVLGAWRRILQLAPATRLLVMAEGAGTLRDRIVESGGGDLAARIDVRPTGSLADYLHAHGEVDCVLDSFPYNGGTTSFHALWMATPVLTLAADHPAGRGGASILSRLDLSDWIASSVDDYVRRAVMWSTRQGDVAKLRVGLRARLESSSLMDGAAFARGFSATLDAIHASRCEQGKT